MEEEIVRVRIPKLKINDDGSITFFSINQAKERTIVKINAYRFQFVFLTLRVEFLACNFGISIYFPFKLTIPLAKFRFLSTNLSKVNSEDALL